MGWLIALGILAALSLLPLGISLRYDADGFCYRLLAGRISFPMPRKKEKKSEKKTAKQSKKNKKTKSSRAKKPAQSKKGGSLADFLPILQVVLEFLDSFRWKLRIRRLEMKLIMAGDDPCDLAVNYGRAWTVLGNLIPQLERCFAIKNRDLEVECDFEANQTLITARLDMTITLGRLLHLLLRYGLRAVKEFLNLKKSKKGGAPK